MYFSKYGAYSVESGLFIFFLLKESSTKPHEETLRIIFFFATLCVALWMRFFLFQYPDAFFDRRFHLRVEFEALPEISVGFSLPAHPQPQHPAIGVDFRVARIDRES